MAAGNYKEIIQMRDDYEKEIQRLLKECVVEGIFSEMDVNVISYAILTMCSAEGKVTQPAVHVRVSAEGVVTLQAVHMPASAAAKATQLALTTAA